MLCQGLAPSVVLYALAVITHSKMQIERLEKIQNESVRIILECSKYTTMRDMRFILDYPAVHHKVQI